jgi:hypothetical protein
LGDEFFGSTIDEDLNPKFLLLEVFLPTLILVLL